MALEDIAILKTKVFYLFTYLMFLLLLRAQGRAEKAAAVLRGACWGRGCECVSTCANLQLSDPPTSLGPKESPSSLHFRKTASDHLPWVFGPSLNSLKGQCQTHLQVLPRL